MTTVEISPVKRERQRKEEKKRLKNSMREALPILTRNEIRRCRIPYHEAILKDLEELGLDSAADFLRQLIQLQEDLRREHGPDSVVSSRPRLIECKKQLDLLYEGLKNAETAHFAGDIGKECDELLKLAVHFSFGSQDWWWLGEQLLIQLIHISVDFNRDGGRKRAIIKYLYGKFVLENLSDAEQAKGHLMEARQESKGKSWTAEKQLGRKQQTIFFESCILLYKALLIEAREVMQYDPVKAVEICTIARQRATEACDRNGEAEASMLRGICEIDCGKPDAALRSFIRVLVLHSKANNVEGVCEARIHMALAYLKIGKTVESLEQLQTILAYAEMHNLPHYLAAAYRLLGEHYLNQGLPHLATPCLIKALKIFHDLDEILNREQAKNLAAISAGQELMSKYVDLILKCGRKDYRCQEFLPKLVKWKDTREPFWSEDDKMSIISLSYGSLEKSLLSVAQSQAVRKYLTEEAWGESFILTKWNEAELYNKEVDDATDNINVHEDNTSQTETVIDT